MPHLTIEYSANLDGRLDLDALCVRLRDTILDTGLFEIGAVRVRAIRCTAFAVADLADENAFLDMVFRIGTGRSPEERHRAGAALFAAAEAETAHLLAAPHFALSLELREIAPALSWKRNAIHPRLRGT